MTQAIAPDAIPLVDPRPETGPGPSSTRRSPTQRIQLCVTFAIVFVPVAAVVAVGLPWVGGATLIDLSLLAGFYVVTGLGITVGYHRLFTHRSFTAARPLRIALAVAGGLAMEGGVIGWVATHRRHHAFADRPGDPHSPYRYGDSGWDQLRGVGHAHLGWLFGSEQTSLTRYAPDLLTDRTMRAVDRAFPLLALATLAFPMLLGWALTGTVEGAVSALIWGGLIRIFLLQHVTWSVNSLCHLIGTRPFQTKREDRATNLWPLALVSFGDSYHNLHHADPTSARHGVGPHEVDIAAGCIRMCERLGWASNAHWPDAERVGACRRVSP